MSIKYIFGLIQVLTVVVPMEWWRLKMKETKDEIHIPIHYNKILNYNMDNIRTRGCGRSFDDWKTAYHQQYKTLNGKNRNKPLNIEKNTN